MVPGFSIREGWVALLSGRKLRFGVAGSLVPASVLTHITAIGQHHNLICLGKLLLLVAPNRCHEIAGDLTGGDGSIWLTNAEFGSSGGARMWAFWRGLVTSSMQLPLARAFVSDLGGSTSFAGAQDINAERELFRFCRSSAGQI